MVRFNTQGQIQQVRIYWDQGLLLKEVEVIGFRGRTWPITDASVQLRSIKAAAATPGQEKSHQLEATSTTATTKKDAETTLPTSTPRKVFKDPYAAESLYDLLSPVRPDRDDQRRTQRAKPQLPHQTRDLGDLFVSQGDDTEEDEKKPKKPIIRETASKNFQPSSAFIQKEEGDDNEKRKGATTTRSKYSAQKFGHFEIGADNSEREVKEKPRPRHNRWNESQWDFRDFVTPEKPSGYVAPHTIRHWGVGDDGEDDQPVQRPTIRTRRDAETHFTLTDDPNEGGQREEEAEEEKAEVNKKNINRAIYQKRALALYQDPLAPPSPEDDDEATGTTAATADPREDKPPLTAVQSNTIAARKKDFDPHWSFSNDDADGDSENKRPPPPAAATTRLKAVQMMEPQWQACDVSPEPKKVSHRRYESSQPTRRTVMNAVQKSWSFGDEDE